MITVSISRKVSVMKQIVAQSRQILKNNIQPIFKLVGCYILWVILIRLLNFSIAYLLYIPTPSILDEFTLSSNIFIDPFLEFFYFLSFIGLRYALTKNKFNPKNIFRFYRIIRAKKYIIPYLFGAIPLFIVKLFSAILGIYISQYLEMYIGFIFDSYWIFFGLRAIFLIFMYPLLFIFVQVELETGKKTLRKKLNISCYIYKRCWIDFLKLWVRFWPWILGMIVVSFIVLYTTNSYYYFEICLYPLMGGAGIYVLPLLQLSQAQIIADRIINSGNR